MRMDSYSRQSKHWLIGWLFVFAFLSACSAASSDDDGLEAGAGGEGSDMGKDDAGEGNGQENFADANNPGSTGAEINSDTTAGSDDLGAAAGPASANATASSPGNAGPNGTTAGGGNSMFGNAEPAPANTAIPGDAPVNQPVNGTIANAPTNNPLSNSAFPAAATAPANATAISQRTQATPPPSATTQSVPSGLMPRSDGRVRYVKEGGVQIVNAPNGNPVANLEQGDHPVTWEENGWLKIADGMYVPVDGLSNRGVGRTKPARVWAQ